MDSSKATMPSETQEDQMEIKQVKIESVQEFLARGGQVKVLRPSRRRNNTWR